MMKRICPYCGDKTFYHWEECSCDSIPESVAVEKLPNANIPAPVTNGFEEKARQVVRRWGLSAYYVKGGCGDECGCVSGVCELAVSAIATALEEAVREERERCAVLADLRQKTYRLNGDKIYSADAGAGLILYNIGSEFGELAEAIRKRNP